MLMPMMAWAKGDVVKEVCGVKYGISYSKAQVKLEKVFGIPDHFKKDEQLAYANREYEGILFDLIAFEFLNKSMFDGNSPKVLKEVMMLIACDTKEMAYLKCAQVADMMRKKYDLEEKEKDGMPTYYGGTNPHNDALVGFSIIIEQDANRYYVALSIWPSPFNA